MARWSGTSSARRLQDVERELGHRAGALKLEGIEPIGRHLAQIAQVGPRERQLRGPTGGEEGDRGGPDFQMAVDVEPAQERLDHPLEAEIVVAADQGESGRLVGERFAGPGEIDVGDLEQVRIGVAMRLVVPAHGQQARHQALPQCVLAPPARMLDADGRSGRAGLERDAQPLRDEAVGERLVEPASGQRPADLRLDPLASAARRARQRDRPIFGDMLVAVDPGDLLDQVDLPLQVGAASSGAGRSAARPHARRVRAPGHAGSASARSRGTSIPSTRAI